MLKALLYIKDICVNVIRSYEGKNFFLHDIYLTEDETFYLNDK